jgi:Fe-S-cluster-containing dehydrogenase component
MVEAFNAIRCTGCRSCELACSYHHQKVFSPNIASIRIQRRESIGRFTIFIYPQDYLRHLSCDCDDGKEFCLNYCPIIAREELRTILQKVKPVER